MYGEKRQMGKSTKSTRDHLPSARLIFGLILALFTFAYLFPQFRVWGVSIWAHHSIPMVVGLFIVGVVFLLGADKLAAVLERATAHNSSRTYVAAVLILLPVLASAFVLLSAKTHFLGDGYTILSELAKENPLVKTRGLGEGLIHVWVKDLFGTGESAALLSYQAISIGTGLIFAAMAAFCSAVLWRNAVERLLFLLGLITGGYMLLFFGYVENYALFALSVLGLILIGLLALQGKVIKWSILIPQALAIFFHVLGIFLLPATIMVLTYGTPLWQKVTRISSGRKMLLGGAIAILAISFFIFARSQSTFFRFAFVPLTPDRFTTGGYTLFSPAHLADVLNLLLLLVPGIVLLILFAGVKQSRTDQATSVRGFLLLASAGSLIAVTVLDPKLGMPRDWDLFSFVGIPLTVLLYWIILSSSLAERARYSLAILAIALGLLSLAPRVLMQTDPSVSAPTFESYLKLDPERSRTGMFILANYYVRQGDMTKATQVEAERRAMFPGEQYIQQAKVAGQQGRLQESKSFTLMALQKNAGFADAWLSLAMCYEVEAKHDSALFAAQIADGLNPYNFNIQNQIALAYLALNEVDRAERIWRELESGDSARYQPPHNLARIAKLRGDVRGYQVNLERAASRQSATGEIYRELGDLLLKQGNPAGAAEKYSVALERGADSASIWNIVNKNPQLKPLLKLGE